MDIGSVLGLEQLTWGTLILVIVAAFAAGWIDAVVGGGGLLQLPALLLIPGISPIQALATNKLASVFGTATSSVTYYRRARPDIRTALPMAAIALAGSFGGAAVATVLPAAAFKPIIVVALLAVALFTAFRPQMGAATKLRFSGHRHHIMAGMAGLVIGFYDGLIGPGTGTFLVISLVALLGYDFLQASAKAKIVNLATNTGALLLFIPHGAVLWLLGGILAIANVAGSYLGSRMAISRGATFIRVVFLLVVVALIAKLGVDVWNENIVPAMAAMR
ncbi:sulfite exporter TauE/SafE family protein [Microbacterium hydrocarbonoxydans]|uniref:sulfite exporter TauE/SafE family protein n=1 Tax=Microbacterium hydrocarbonoxydans TaxID=273678 RepID=UPI00203EE67B|nr:TSUP family transporter [Microbacterium hydrocarbonoxydans]MCM3781212.1 TSUP family transporter [Microbacterium hydrocarbonoxydans]